MAILDVRKTDKLVIVAEADQNYSVNLNSTLIDDVGYSLTLISQDRSITNVFDGTNLILTSNNIELVFEGADYKKGKFFGTLESDSKDADKYLKINIELRLE